MDVKLLMNRKKYDKYEVLIDLCRNKNVLDIGCAGQDLNYDSHFWLHGKIAKIARNITGVDVNAESVNKLNSLGYNILLPAEINTIENKFDIIVMADVIEHVDNPVEFLNRYSQYLEKEGSIIITTPNAKRAIDYLNILLSNKFWINEEHTMWFCPYTISEVVRRAGLEVTYFCWLKNYKIPGRKFQLKASFLKICSDILSFIRPMFSTNFMVIIQKNEGRNLYTQ